MKKLLSIFAAAVALSISVTPAYAQDPASEPPTTQEDVQDLSPDPTASPGDVQGHTPHPLDLSSAQTEETDEVHAAGVINYSCGPAYWPYTYYPKTSDRFIEEQATGASRGGVGLYNGYDYWLWWAWGSSLRAGDVISLDWADGNVKNYHACHKTVPSGATSATTYAVNWVSHRWFRACVKAGSAWKCTRWWGGTW